MGFIDKPQQVWWRKVIFQVHLWVGLLLAVYVVVISISGCVLIFGNEITNDAPSVPLSDAIANPIIWTKLVADAQRLHPDYHVIQIEDGGYRGKAIWMRLAGPSHPSNLRHRSLRDIYFDGANGQLLVDRDGNRQTQHPIYSFIADLHTNLLSGRVGRRLNSILALFLFVLCITGSVIWWPGRRVWRQGLTVKWKASWKRTNFDLHRALGLWALLAISMWAITGVYFGFSGEILTGLAKVVPFAKADARPRSHWHTGDPLLPISDLYLSARRVAPDERIIRITLPQRTGEPVYVSVAARSAPESLHIQTVLLQPATGEIMQRRDDWKNSRVGDIIVRSLVLLHSVGFRSLPVRLALAFLGMSPALLAITGGLMWWNRVLSKYVHSRPRLTAEHVRHEMTDAPDFTPVPTTPSTCFDSPSTAQFPTHINEA